MTTGMSSEQPQSQRRLAEVSWSADDVQTLRPDWDDERCIQFLEDNEEDIQCAMIARGWDAVSDILRREEHRQ